MSLLRLGALLQQAAPCAQLITNGAIVDVKFDLIISINSNWKKRQVVLQIAANARPPQPWLGSSPTSLESVNPITTPLRSNGSNLGPCQSATP